MYSIQSDAKFMFRMGVLLLIMSVLAFAPSYFVPMVSGDLGQTSGWLHPHAAFSLMWIVIFILQPFLIINHNVSLHRKVGYAALFIAVGNVITGLGFQLAIFPVEASGIRFDGSTFRLFQSIPTYILFLGLALFYRKRTDYHLRYMYQTAFAAITSIIARLLTFYTPIEESMVGPFVGIISTLFIVALPVYDKLTYGRVHRASWIGLGVFILFQMVIGATVLSADWWIAFATGAN